MFRRYIDSINKAHKLTILVCDEAHRLKNIAGTQTTNALRKHPAPLRLLLTGMYCHLCAYKQTHNILIVILNICEILGTPIQNNLEELYALTHFINPKLFGGNIKVFNNVINLPICAGQQCLLNNTMDVADSNVKVYMYILISTLYSLILYDLQYMYQQAKQILHTLLNSVMLRRTQDNVLKYMLPTRYVDIIYLDLNDIQTGQYKQIESDIMRYIYFQSMRI